MAVPEKYVVSDVVRALATRAHPTITVWNRLEGRPRRADFDRALRAEIRDAWWMLSRQWQTGEFAAEDAGSPVFAKIRLRNSELSHLRPGDGAPRPIPSESPLEAQIERRPISWRVGAEKAHLDLRAQVGRQWSKMLGDAGLGGYRGAYRGQYRFELPARDAAGDRVYAHHRDWQRLAALSGRVIDGGELLEHLADPTHRASDGITLGDPADGPQLDALGAELADWFRNLYTQPESDGAWRPEYLEYQLACNATQAGGEVVLEASEYHGGHLDWFSFDRSDSTLGAGPTAAEQVTVRTTIPAPIAFEGIPDRRWWALEDRKTDFGAVTPATTDLAQLLLVEFGLTASDDWFTIPLRFPAGTLARVEGLAVTNNFGERTWIPAAGAGPEDAWQRWAMFGNSRATGGGAADTSLLIPPSTARTLDGAPIDDVALVRDEVANMVWAIERTVPTLSGPGRAGKDEARETLEYHRRLAPPPAAAAGFKAPIHYLAMSSIPEHWIPFVAVHVPGSVRETQLQRGRMPRVIEGGPTPPDTIEPRSALIRSGLDEAPPRPYLLYEEEVTRAGTSLSRRFRRTRWTGGQAPVWLGVLKQTGRGERQSRLAFDSIVSRG